MRAWAAQPPKQNDTDVPGATIEGNGDVGGSKDELAEETPVSSWRTAAWTMALRSSRDNVIRVPSAPAEAAAGGVPVVGVDPEDDIAKDTKS